MNLTANFTLEQITKSDTATRLGIDNSLPQDMIPYWTRGCQELEKILLLPVPSLSINSGYRSIELNNRIPGSSKTSQHTGRTNHRYCCAFDLESNAGNGKLFHAVRLSGLEFDQLIWEYGDDENPAWVHIGFVFGRKMRSELLCKRTGTVKYEVFVP